MHFTKTPPLNLREIGTLPGISHQINQYLMATSVVCLSLMIVGVSIRIFTKSYLLKMFVFEECAYIFRRSAKTSC